MREEHLLQTGGGGEGQEDEEEEGLGHGHAPHSLPAPSDSPELSDALRHVQRRQHLLEDGALHVGAAQVRLLQVAAGKVAVLQGRSRRTRLELGWPSHQTSSRGELVALVTVVAAAAAAAIKLGGQCEPLPADLM